MTKLSEEVHDEMLDMNEPHLFDESIIVQMGSGQ